MSGRQAGAVTGLWRFPVKSMGGERVEEVALDPSGIRGDRWWAVRDLEADVILSARKLPALLGLRAAYLIEPTGPISAGGVPPVVITLPDGDQVRSDEARVDEVLSGVLGRPVRLEALDPAATAQQRLPWRQRFSQLSARTLVTDFGITREDPLPDLSRMRLRPVLTLAGNVAPPGGFVDLAPIHLLSENSVGAVAEEFGRPVEARRFRPNLIWAADSADAVSDLPEAAWEVGSRIHVGAVTLLLSNPTIRCVVPSRAHDDLPVESRLTRAVAAVAGRYLGVYADITPPGSIHVGDALVVEPPRAPNGVRRTWDATRRTALRGLVAGATRLRR